MGGKKEKDERIKIPLPSEKACIEIGKILFECGYTVHTDKEPTEKGKRSQFYLECWKE